MITLLAMLAASSSFDPVPSASSITPDSLVVAEIERLGSKSATGVAFSVDGDGTIVGCAVEQSSGSETLDREACALVMTRARWAPSGADGAGSAPRTHRIRIVWDIEE